MRFLILTLAICLAASSAWATDPTYAAKAAAATAAAAAAAAAAHAAPIDGAQDVQAEPEHQIDPVVDAPAAGKPAIEKPAAENPVSGEPTAKPAALSAQAEEDIARIQAYLNDLKSIAADFLQVDDQGGMTRGTIEIERPGKMRVTYAPPSHDFIVADGDYVHIWDASLKSQTNVPEDSSLADFILRDPIRLSGDVTVTKFQRFPAKLELTLVQTNDPGAGQLTLIFEDHPLLLRQWRVLDAQGRTTGVNLENERSGVQFAHNTFDFVPPDFAKTGREQ